ncbi:MAG: hypothetical protein ABSG40_08695 [Terriglobales bacterium]|jgi:hypothetical protein
MKLTPEQIFSIFLVAAGGLIGLISGVLGAVVNSIFTSRREHRRWLFDQKRVEYRELLDGLHECMENMSGAFLSVNVTKPQNLPDVAIARGNILIQSRIFVGPALEKFGIQNRWEELAAYVIQAEIPRNPAQKGCPTLTSFQLKCCAFEDELNNFVRKDLGIES